jgi:predicted alpha/beta-fold hydrolase
MSNGRPQDYTDPMKPSGDMSLAIELTKVRHPNSKICGLGYSLGGNFLANYLGSGLPKCELFCGASVCSPYDVTGGFIMHWYSVFDKRLTPPRSKLLDRAPIQAR